MSSKNIYIPTPCKILEQMFWDYIPPTDKELKEGSSTTHIGRSGEQNGMWGRKQSNKQKKAVGKSAKERFTGVRKWYKINNHIMIGSDNPKSRKVYAEGKEYDTIRECCEAYGFKNHNAIRYRLNHPKWTEWYYLN